MKSLYPLEIIILSEEYNNPRLAFSKGHHVFQEFIDRTMIAYTFNNYESPKHTWMRAIPTPNDKYSYCYKESKPHAKGSFPCTVMELS